MTVVIGYVPNAAGQAALDAAIEEAGRRSEPLHVINVGESGDPSKDPKFVQEGDLERLRGRLTDTGVPFQVEQLVRGRDAAEEVVDAAERVGASLVVIGMRRRSPTGKLLFGSQAQRILLDADCPVLAVKASH